MSSLPWSGLRPVRWIIGLLFLALVSGCSAIRLGYGQAPELAYWWLDAYADFDDQQSPKVRDGLQKWFAWHRRTQLPDYADLLARVRAELPGDTTPARTCALGDELRARADIAAARGVPIAAEIVGLLSTEQLANVKKRFDKVNAEFRDEFLQPDPQQRKRKNLERAVERAERLYGRLDDGQRARLEKLLADSPFDADLWLAERMARQQEALQVLARATQGAGPDANRAAIRAFADHAMRSPREAYRRYDRRLGEFNCVVSAELHNMTTAAQRQTAVERLKGWEDDLRALAADAR